jgi:hypothetical protein
VRRSTIGIILVLALGCPVAPHTAEAQQPVKVHRIGVLEPASTTIMASAIEALRQGLHELGYVEGRNLTLDIRWAEWKSWCVQAGTSRDRSPLGWSWR